MHRAKAEVESLFQQSDKAGSADETASSASKLQRGWERNALLSLYFGPSPSSLVDPDASFKTLTDKWIVAPVTDTLIYRSSRVQPEIARWVDDVAKWDFTMISPRTSPRGPARPPT